VHRAAPILADLRRRASTIGRESSHNAEQRGLTVHEVVSTERSYLADLRLLTKVYKPALTAAVSGVAADYRGHRSSVAPGVLNSIFHPSLEPLVELHAELLVLLEAAETDANAASAAAAVGKALSTIVPYLRLYAGYCADYTHTVQAVQSVRLLARAAAALRGIEEPGRSLESLLIKPVQRLCRYPLFLAAVLKLLPQGSAEHAELEASLRAVQQLNREVNAKVLAAERAAALQELVQELGGVGKLGRGVAEALLAPTCTLLVQRDVRLTVNLADSPAEVGVPPHRQCHLAVLTSGLLLCRYDAWHMHGGRARLNFKRFLPRDGPAACSLEPLLTPARSLPRQKKQRSSLLHGRRGSVLADSGGAVGGDAVGGGGVGCASGDDVGDKAAAAAAAAAAVAATMLELRCDDEGLRSVHYLMACASEEERDMLLREFATMRPGES
jgi:hypothetical protein